MLVEIWSDVVCPWCYIGKRRFETAAASFGHPVEVVWRSYELNPGRAGACERAPPSSAIARKYGISGRSRPRRQYERITDLARAEGLDYHLDRARSGPVLRRPSSLAPGARSAASRTRSRNGCSPATSRRGRDRPSRGARPARRVGRSRRRRGRAVLAGDAYGDAVRADEARADRDRDHRRAVLRDRRALPDRRSARIPTRSSRCSTGRGSGGRLSRRRRGSDEHAG